MRDIIGQVIAVAFVLYFVLGIIFSLTFLTMMAARPRDVADLWRVISGEEFTTGTAVGVVAFTFIAWPVVARAMIFEGDG